MSESDQELSVIERFRESHHAVARMFASGMTPSMIRQKTGYSQRRLSLLWGDPSFQELIAVYAKRIGEVWDATVDAYVDLGVANMLRAEMQLAEHLDHSEDTGELLPIGALDRISQGRADRFGYSKHVAHDHKHDFASMLDKAIERSTKVIEGQALQVLPTSVQSVPQGAEVARSPQPSHQPRPRSFVSVLSNKKRRSA